MQITAIIETEVTTLLLSGDQVVATIKDGVVTLPDSQPTVTVAVDDGMTRVLYLYKDAHDVAQRPTQSATQALVDRHLGVIPGSKDDDSEDDDDAILSAEEGWTDPDECQEVINGKSCRGWLCTECRHCMTHEGHAAGCSNPHSRT